MSLKDSERAARKELRDAQKFITENQLGSLPGHRFENGESAGRQSVEPGRRREEDGLPRLHRDTLSYDGYQHQTRSAEYSYDGFDSRSSPAERFEEDHPEARFVTLGASLGPLSHDEVDKRARMHHVYSVLREEQVDLLRRWGIEGMTLQAIADEDGVSKQAVHKRLAKARAAFEAAFTEHWDDEVLWDA